MNMYIHQGYHSVPYRPVRPEYTVPASNLVHSTSCFVLEKIPAVPTNFGQYWPVQKKSFFFFFFFLSFVIFEFLLGQNSNLFALNY